MIFIALSFVIIIVIIILISGRFVFIDNSTGAIKLEKPVSYPLETMDLTSYLSGPLQSDNQAKFDLYGVVNHVGTVGGGHYTSYSMHHEKKTWVQYDDHMTDTEMKPGDRAGDEASAYVLFYKKKGASQ